MNHDDMQTLRDVPYPTPFLYLDLAKVEQAYRNFRQVLPKVRIHYAMKCNPDLRLLRRIQALGGTFEIASYTELGQLMSIGVRPQEVIFSNPVKVPADIRAAFTSGLDRFSFDSQVELEKLAEHAPGSRVFVRIRTVAANSEVPSEGKFGISTAMALDLMQNAVKLGLKPYGIAFHVGSQMLHAQEWDEPIKQSASLMRDLQERGITIQMLDVGGGFPASHGGNIPALKEFGAVINAAVERYLPYPVDIIAEPGRGLVSDAGVMVATVIGTAQRPDGNWVHLDVGAFNGMMEALESRNTLVYPLADSKNNATKRAFNLTGPSCDSQDTIMFGAQLSDDIAVGDRVFIGTAGAYTTSYASNFNGFEIPQMYCTLASESAIL